jgi:general secretion pathway protein H
VLLDVVLALAILSLAAMVLMPRPRAGLSPADLQAEAARTAAVFRQGRATAIREGSHADVVVDASARSVRTAGAPRVELREGIDLKWVTSNLCPMVDGARALRFLADGRSCGGVLTMAGAGASMQLRIDWLTGRVEMSTP